MKVCPKCKRKKLDSDFNWKIKKSGVRAVYCRECSRQYVKNHYKNNKQYYLEKAKKNNQILKKETIKMIAEYLKTHPCVDCGENDILVLEFDHKYPDEKFDNISTMIKRRLSLKKLKNEIDRCEVRCSNCHRRKTEIETNSWKLKYAPVA